MDRYGIGCIHFGLLGTCKAAGVRKARDVVTGARIPPFIMAQNMRDNEAYCGGEGRWFSRKEIPGCDKEDE